MNYIDTLNQAWQDHLAPRAPNAPTVISTFAGCGGSSLGYSMAGFCELLAVEWDEHAVATFKANFPHVPVYHGDIARLSVDQCLEMAGVGVGELNVFDGSPPCFPSGTKIMSIDGIRAIETMKPGAMVVTHNGAFREVSKVHSRDYVGELVMIEPEDGRDGITCTPNHQFFVRRAASVKSAANNSSEPEWVMAANLCEGDLLLEPTYQRTLDRDTSASVNLPSDRSKHTDRNGAWIPITRMHRTVPVSCRVYNLEVDCDHSYTANGFAVHNCQGFSTSGKRAFDDDRNQLFREYVRLLRGLQPKIFIMENVSGMVKGKMKLIFAEIMRELKASGYQVSVRLLNAAYYGVPQRRERVIFIGVRSDLGVAPSHPLGCNNMITVKEALRGCTPSEIVPLIGKNLQKMQMIRPGATYKEKKKATMAVFGKMGGFTFNRIRWGAPCPTILKTVCVSSTFGAGLVMPDEDRYISISELKRLGSFPDQFQFEGSFEERWARIGNSVPPLLARAIGKHLRTAILTKVNLPVIMPVAA